MITYVRATVGRVFLLPLKYRYHIGMGADPHDMIADNYERGGIPQAYSPLAHGALANSPDVDVVKPHYRGKSTAQLAYKWVLQHDVSICTSIAIDFGETLHGMTFYC